MEKRQIIQAFHASWLNPLLQQSAEANAQPRVFVGPEGSGVADLVTLLSGPAPVEHDLSVLAPAAIAELLGRLADKKAIVLNRSVLLKSAERVWGASSGKKTQKTLEQKLTTVLKKNPTVFLSARSLVKNEMSKALYALLEKRAIFLPRLSDDRERLAMLMQNFLTGQPPLKIDALAHERLLQHNWPGDVEELHLVLTQAARTCVEQTITVDDLLLPVAVSSGFAEFPQHLPPQFRS